jgi:hypothetical protein
VLGAKPPSYTKEAPAGLRGLQADFSRVLLASPGLQARAEGGGLVGSLAFSRFSLLLATIVFFEHVENLAVSLNDPCAKLFGIDHHRLWSPLTWFSLERPSLTSNY